MHRSLVRSSRRLAAAAACVLALFAAGCEDDPAAPEVGINFVGTWRGQPWQGTAEPHLSADSLFILGAAGESLSRLVVRASVRYDGPGRYPLAPGAAEVWLLVGGDQIAERYVSLSAADALLIVGRHAGGEITGRLTFTARALDPPAGTAPAEGRFDAEFVQAEVRP